MKFSSILPFLAFFLLLLAPELSARHIIGGVVYYECLGDGTYRFTAKMYRDCAGNGADFDGNAAFTIYKGEETIPLVNKDVFLDFQEVTSVAPPDNPCITLPPGVCVEEATYEFEETFADWPSTESYHITYQRCCRNNFITNIVNPDATGATFTVEITPEAQAADACNSTPIFDNFPPIVVCQGEPINFNHSATDPDGDQLVYSLCAPYAGGGLQGTPNNPGNPNGCQGVTPDPACPPPYEEVNFINPPYNVFNPLGGSDPLTIDPTTGVLTGTPPNQGQYVVGVCVTEIRNGIPLTTVRREFQFNVGNCINTLVAVVDGDEPGSANETAIIQSCGDTVITVGNSSITGVTFEEFQWTFDLGNDQFINPTDWEPTITFPGPGIYPGQLVLNPGSECNDTANVEVRIFSTTTASLTAEYDTCVSGPVNFFDESQLSAELESILWTFGDGSQDDTRNPVHEYDEPGLYSVQLSVNDLNDCADDTTILVSYQPAPAVLVIAPNDQLGCVPASIDFLNRSNPIDESYLVQWTFGDGDTTFAISPNHIYRDTGIFDIGLAITSPIGCFADTIFEDLVTIVPPPIARYTYSPPYLSQLAPDIQLTDQSTDAARWDWFLDGKIISNQQDFVFSMPDTGLQELTLVVTHQEFCQDTFTQLVDVVPEPRWHMPNAFTPNGDGINDVLLGQGVLLGVQDFSLRVFNRYGQVIFETDDPQVPWDGGSERQVPVGGVYVWEVSFTDGRGNPFREQGFITIVK